MAVVKRKLTGKEFEELIDHGVTDFTSYDLSLLQYEDFKRRDLRGINFSGCNIKKMDLQYIRPKKLYGTNLSENDLSSNTFNGIDIRHANLSKCNLQNFNPQRVCYKRINDANLTENDLSYLNKNAFDGVDVREANLSNCNLKNFYPRRVFRKNLYGVNLSQNDLSYLEPESFYDVYIFDTNFENTGARIDLTMIDRNSKIGNVKGCIITNFEEVVWSNLDYDNKFTYKEDSFDEEFISKHKEYFLDKEAPNKLKEKFYSGALKIDDFGKYYDFLKDKNYKLFFEKRYGMLLEFFKLEDAKKITKSNPKNIDMCLKLNKAEEIYNWYNIHKFVPQFIVVANFPKDQIHKFNCKRWSNLMKNEEFNKNDDAKVGLLKAAMVMGAFEKEEQGYTRLLQLINQEYKVPDSKENEKCKVLNSVDVHRIFDSMKMVYDEDFRKLFMENFKRILTDATFSYNISSIQRNYADIKEEYKGKRVTLEMCENYLENISYDNVKDGCHELAIYAKNNGYNQSDFEKLQETFLKGKQRESSSIPQIHVKTEGLKGRVLRLDDPLALVLGNLTECCQKLYGAGESSMLHSILEKNGRVFVVEDEAGRVVAQSWLWRNGNVLCFDNIEVPDRALMRRDEILEAYNQAANEIVSKDRETFERMLKQDKVSEKQAKELKLSKITVGKGYTDVSLNKLEKDNERIMPEESGKKYNGENLYISDSKEQYILYKASGYKKSEEKFEIENLNLYKDGRDVVKEVKGEKIHKDVIRLIKGIELQAFPQEKHLLQEIQSYKDIAHAYDYDKDNMRVVYNKDWYMVYEKKDKDVYIGDIVKVKSATPQEDVMAVKEREKQFYKLLNKYKDIHMEARDNANYVLMKTLQKTGKIDILVEEALGDFRGGEKLHNFVVTKNEKDVLDETAVGIDR